MADMITSETVQSDRSGFRLRDAVEEKLEELAAFKAEHGHVTVPVRNPDKSLNPLGQWLNRCCSEWRKGKLRPAIARRLEEIGGEEILRRVGLSGKRAGPSRPGEICGSLEDLVAAGRTFRCIYADPPWRYENRATRAAAERHYPTMSDEEIARLPVARLAAQDAWLHLWTTNGHLEVALSIMRAWGFEFKSQFVWVKPQIGLGNYWRIAHEILLLGRRGTPQWRARDLRSWGEFPRRKHSAKPEEVRAMIERACDGPYLELFGRRVAPGWTVWGNQIETDLFSEPVSARSQPSLE
ncbi:hypothetical protein FR698_14940 [Pelomicrobium methylotrophicum]|uniref:Helicase-associated domain-containing protein n=2 Tax=Pelomicrobium methylotrophicum TaxID=2602750 RepID=A0A5C7EGS8_9PROT|nr:hypothetical protein FR698_14940 [Pelomicrobium methylotrophicum]